MQSQQYRNMGSARSGKQTILVCAHPNYNGTADQLVNELGCLPARIKSSIFVEANEAEKCGSTDVFIVVLDGDRREVEEKKWEEEFKVAYGHVPDRVFFYSPKWAEARVTFKEGYWRERIICDIEELGRDCCMGLDELKLRVDCFRIVVSLCILGWSCAALGIMVTITYMEAGVSSEVAEELSLAFGIMIAVIASAWFMEEYLNVIRRVLRIHVNYEISCIRVLSGSYYWCWSSAEIVCGTILVIVEIVALQDEDVKKLFENKTEIMVIEALLLACSFTVVILSLLTLYWSVKGKRRMEADRHSRETDANRPQLPTTYGGTFRGQ